VKILAKIPLSLGLRKGGDEGTPIVLSNPEDPAAQAITELARVIAHSGPSRAGINLGITPIAR
jgi:ATP-binding protein involved in chromosome partitioning